MGSVFTPFIIDYQHDKHRQHVKCKPEYDPQYDFSVSGDKCQYSSTRKMKCGEEGLDQKKNWCWTKYVQNFIKKNNILAK